MRAIFPLRAEVVDRISSRVNRRPISSHTVKAKNNICPRCFIDKQSPEQRVWFGKGSGEASAQRESK